MHRFANPARFLRLARWLTPLLLVTGVALATVSLAWGLLRVPPDRLMGDTVRILFIHVPAAWLGMSGWTAIAIASLAELVWRHPLAGIAARAASVPGAAFTAICLATGSIWARPTWGTWWVWDGRLTSFLVLAVSLFRLHIPWPMQPGARAAIRGSWPCSAWSAQSTSRSSTARWCGGTACTSPPVSRWANRRSTPLSSGPCWPQRRFLADFRRHRAGADADDPGRCPGRSPAAPQGRCGSDRLMREALNQWDFVLAAYAVGITGTALVTGWSWLVMRRAERQRERSRDQGRET